MPTGFLRNDFAGITLQKNASIRAGGRDDKWNGPLQHLSSVNKNLI
jgi:hypothetical protein